MLQSTRGVHPNHACKPPVWDKQASMHACMQEATGTRSMHACNRPSSQVLHLTNPDVPDKLAEAQIDTPKT